MRSLVRMKDFCERLSRGGMGIFSGAPVGRAYVSMLDAPVCAGASGQGGFKCSIRSGPSEAGHCHRNVRIAMKLDGINCEMVKEFNGCIRRVSRVRTT
jgi:hypothetical protein